MTENDDVFYFHSETKNLMRIVWGKGRDKDALHETDFGRFLYREYGINANDNQLITDISAIFTEDSDLEPITPRRIMTNYTRESIEGTSEYYQLSDSAFIDIRMQSLHIRDNGYGGIMFLKGQVDPIDTQLLLYQISERKQQQVTNWWANIIDSLNVVQTTPDISVKQTKRLYSLLMYISPWFLKWNRTQLPIEIVTGEAGSGKSSLLELRQTILTGFPRLRNSPTDVRDWYAGIINAGGVFTMDNVQFTNKQIRQRLSDEICRIITESNPHVEMRKLYTTAENYRVPISCTFAITSIVPPFSNQDILQRSFPLHLNAIRHQGKGFASHESNWVESCIELHEGGREGWLAHHIIIVQRILKSIELNWDDGYLSKCRFANLEQLLVLCHKLFYPHEDSSWIPTVLSTQTKAEGNETQWTLDGLRDFYNSWRLNKTTFAGIHGFGTKEIAIWCKDEMEYRDSYTLTNSRALAKFLTSYEQTIKEEVGIGPLGRSNNRTIYTL